jgi:hypothetical protein
MKKVICSTPAGKSPAPTKQEPLLGRGAGIGNVDEHDGHIAGEDPDTLAKWKAMGGVVEVRGGGMTGALKLR